MKITAGYEITGYVTTLMKCISANGKKSANIKCEVFDVKKIMAVS